MPISDDPLDVMTMVPPHLETAFRSLFELARLSQGEVGGITIAKGRAPRVFVYKGPCPEKLVEEVARGLLGDGYQVSTVRDDAQFKKLGMPRFPGQYRTATARNPTAD
jgi:hypothetical protein